MRKPHAAGRKTWHGNSGDKGPGATSLPGASPDPVITGTSLVVSRQPVQHRLSLTITGHLQSQLKGNTLFHAASRAGQRNNETCGANFIASPAKTEGA